MKSAFFDTSAVMPLFLAEPRSDDAAVACQAASRIYAWSWMRVELEAGFIRRQVDQVAWMNWRIWVRDVYWIDLSPEQYDHVCTFNRAVHLRAADAGHLFLCDQAMRVIPDLTLVTFDAEMKSAAEAIGLTTWNV